MGSRRQDVDVEIMILDPSGARSYIKSMVTPPRRPHYDKMSDEDVLVAATILYRDEIRHWQKQLEYHLGFGFPLN